MHEKEVVVIGAGMVGVCSALALQGKGIQVTLIDSEKPGVETSFGNAGMITPSSLIPINNPRLFKSLPSFLSNRSAGFRYSLNYAMSELSTLLKFLSYSKQHPTEQRIQHLYGLIERSIELHLQQASKVNCFQSLRHTGWLKLYRQSQTFKNSAYEQQIYQQYDVQFKTLDADQIHALEPNLKAIYQHGLLVNDALSVANPGALVKAYANDFVEKGGQYLQFNVKKLIPTINGWVLLNDQGKTINCRQLVIATGPWSKELLEPLGLKLPMIFERGSHREYFCAANSGLNTPIHDVDGSFVASPHDKGVRISCGVELNQLSATHVETQLNLVEKNARKGFDFAKNYHSQWHGARPTMPDSLPVIGASKRAGLWLNTGHQHIGFSTGPGSAEILTNLMVAEASNSTFNPFNPSRFKL